MRRKSHAPSPRPPGAATAPGAPAAPAPRVRRRLALVVFVPLLALTGWGAWSLWRPDPLREVHAALDRRDFRAADDLLAKHLEANPNDRAALLLAARTARRGGDAGRAVDLLRNYARAFPADEAHDLELALIRVQNGSRAEGEKLFAEYSARPDSPDTPYVMEAQLEGGLRLNAASPHDMVDLDGPGPAAVARLQQAAELWLRLRPSRADQIQGLIWQGRLYRFARQHAEGVAKLREAVALDPDHFDARLYLALALGEESPEESVRHLEALLVHRPDARQVKFHLATIQRARGRAAEARRLLEEMVAANRDELAALIELGLLDLDEGKLADAEPRLRRALELGPDLTEPNLAMSRCLLLMGKPDEAAKYRKRASEVETARNARNAPKH